MPTPDLGYAGDIEPRMGSLALAFGNGANVVVTMPQMVGKAYLEPMQISLGAQYDAAWQATAPSFIGQLSAGGEHYHPRANMPKHIERIYVPEGTPVTRRGRPVEEDGTVLFLTDVDFVSWRLYELTGSSSEALSSEALLAEDVMYSSLQVTSAWRRDAVGYSFEHTTPGEHLREGGRVYRVEYIFRLASGETRFDRFEIGTLPAMTPSSEF